MHCVYLKFLILPPQVPGSSSLGQSPHQGMEGYHGPGLCGQGGWISWLAPPKPCGILEVSSRSRGAITQKGRMAWQMKATEVMMGSGYCLWVQSGRRGWKPSMVKCSSGLWAREVKDSDLQISEALEETEAYFWTPAGRGSRRRGHTERGLPAPGKTARWRGGSETRLPEDSQ